jgi:hypothetical protein
MKTNFLPQLQMDFSGGLGEDSSSSPVKPKTFEELFAGTGIEPTKDENGGVHYNFNATLKTNNMREKFTQQLQENKTVTEESLALSKNKTYHNGDEVKVGDKPLFGMVLEIDEEDNKQISLIMLNESQIDLYETDDRHIIADTYIPIIKLK